MALLVVGLIVVASFNAVPHGQVMTAARFTRSLPFMQSGDENGQDEAARLEAERIQKQISLGASTEYVEPPSIVPALGLFAVLAAVVVLADNL